MANLPQVFDPDIGDSGEFRDLTDAEIQEAAADISNRGTEEGTPDPTDPSIPEGAPSPTTNPTYLTLMRRVTRLLLLILLRGKKHFRYVAIYWAVQ